jgi:hypothetical protein
MCRFLKEIKYFFLVSNTGVSNELQKASLCGPLSIDAVYRLFSTVSDQAPITQTLQEYVGMVLLD